MTITVQTRDEKADTQIWKDCMCLSHNFIIKNEVMLFYNMDRYDVYDLLPGNVMY